MKTKKTITDSYKKYTFKDADFLPFDSIPEWLDQYSYLLVDQSIFGFENKDDVIVPIVYTLYDREKHPLYVGKTFRLIDRIYYHDYSKDKREPWMKDVVYIGLTLCNSLDEMDLIEVLEIHKKLPKYTSDCRNDIGKYVAAFEIKNQLNIQASYTEDVILYETFIDDFLH